MTVSFTGVNIFNTKLYSNIQKTEQGDILSRIAMAKEKYGQDAFVFEKTQLAKDGMLSDIIVADGIDGKALINYEKMINELESIKNKSLQYSESLSYMKTMVEDTKAFFVTLVNSKRQPEKLSFTFNEGGNNLQDLAGTKIRQVSGTYKSIA